MISTGVVVLFSIDGPSVFPSRDELVEVFWDAEVGDGIFTLGFTMMIEYQEPGLTTSSFPNYLANMGKSYP